MEKDESGRSKSTRFIHERTLHGCSTHVKAQTAFLKGPVTGAKGESALMSPNMNNTLGKGSSGRLNMRGGWTNLANLSHLMRKE
jgi:hypothetical protein